MGGTFIRRLFAKKEEPDKADSIHQFIESSYCSITRSGWHLPYRGCRDFTDPLYLHHSE
jgi:hypothetical protein